MFKGNMSPNWAQVGEMPIGGNGSAMPFGGPAISAASGMAIASMQGGGVDLAASSMTPYRPSVERADRLSANIPFVSGSYYNGRGSNI